MNEETATEVRRLPLWKACLDDMRTEAVNYGKVYSSEFFEEKLKCPRDSMQFGLAIAEIRRELEKDGFYLSGRGQRGNQYVILPPSSNVNVMVQYQRAAVDALKRGVILGTNTRLDTLTDSERRKHESALERMAIKAALMQRSTAIYRTTTKHAPSLVGK